MNRKALTILTVIFFVLIFSSGCQKEKITVTINGQETKIDQSMMNILSKTNEPVPKVGLTEDYLTYDVVYKKNHYYVFAVKAPSSSSPDMFVRVPHLDTQYQISSFEYEKIQKAAKKKETD